MEGFRVALIGDVHLQWGQHDVDYFNASDYDLVLFVGDLAGYSHKGGLDVCRSISKLEIPALVMPGNHDAAHASQLVAEIASSKALVQLTSSGQERRVEEMAEALGVVPLVGYSNHSFSSHGVPFTVVAARPHSMGGGSLSFAPYLRRRFGIRSLDESGQRLRELVEASPHERVLFLAHNGPTGLGPKRHHIWGCDFKKAEGDFGDPDLREAINHAKGAGKTVVGVVAGHMHHHLRGGGLRDWYVIRDGVPFVNCARVPRVFTNDDGDKLRHHVRLVLGEEGLSVEEVLVNPDLQELPSSPAQAAE